MAGQKKVTRPAPLNVKSHEYVVAQEEEKRRKARKEEELRKQGKKPVKQPNVGSFGGYRRATLEANTLLNNFNGGTLFEDY